MNEPDPAALWRQVATRQAGPGYARRYAARFAELAAQGAEVHGEADFVAARLPSGASVLDAGCGTGRVAARLHDLGFRVVGVDVDPAMVHVAREQRPELTWEVVDLGALALRARFDAVVMAGNVVPFLATPLEEVMGRLAEHLEPDGLLVCGFGLDQAHLPSGARRVPLPTYDAAATAAGLEPVDRLAGWDGSRYDDGGYVVTLHRRPAPPRQVQRA